MNLLRRLSSFLGPLSFILIGAGPVLLQSEATLASLINLLGWLFAALFNLRSRRIKTGLTTALEELQVSSVGKSETQMLSALTTISTRRFTASYGFLLDGERKTRNVSRAIRKLSEFALKELEASAVEFSLLDSESKLWSESLLLGTPQGYDVQCMLDGDASGSIPEDLSEKTGKIHTLLQPVHFAGKTFGMLRVEMLPGKQATSETREILRLLSLQAGILLIDSRFNEEILRLRKLGDETSQAKTGFLANLSHEIRGPLGIILNGAELALDGLCGPLNTDQKETLVMIKESGDHLLDLVNDVLDFAKVEAGTVIAHPVPIQVNEMLEDLVSVVRTQAHSKKHELNLDEVPASIGVLCDKRHARQMLINFLTNAIKYTPEGGKIQVRAQAISHGRVRISVKDSGIGIPEDQKHKVFGAFERIDDSYAMSQVGTGLGMPLTKKLAEVNSGKVGFQSEQGKGSTFWLILPATDVSEAEEPVADDETPRMLGQGEGILIVDHNEETRTMLERFLSEQGFNVYTAKSGSEVVKLLRDKRVELAVVENDLPGLPGEEVIAIIRSTPHAGQIPIVLLSGRAFVFDIERFLKLGVDRCLSKPVSLHELAKTARKLLEQSKFLQESSAPQSGI